MLIKCMCDSKSQTLRKSYPFQSTSRLISRWNRWSFCVYMIPLWNFIPECNSRSSTTSGVNSCRSDSCRHDILWWYRVNKYRAMRGNRSELPLVLKSPQCHTLLITNWPQKTVISNTNTGLIKKIWYIKMRAFCTITYLGWHLVFRCGRILRPSFIIIIRLSRWLWFILWLVYLLRWSGDSCKGTLIFTKLRVHASLNKSIPLEISSGISMPIWRIDTLTIIYDYYICTS